MPKTGTFASQWRAGLRNLENPYPEREILLGVLPDGDQQIVGILHDTIGIVEQRGILQQFARRTLAGIQTRQQSIHLGNGVIHLMGKFWIFRQ